MPIMETIESEKSERFQLFEAGRDVGRDEVYRAMREIAEEWKDKEFYGPSMSIILRYVVLQIQERLEK